MPQALEGVATVAVLYATVRRWFTPCGGLARGRRARSYSCRCADVPLQQPRRLAGAAADSGCLRGDKGTGSREHSVACACRIPRRSGIPDEDDAGILRRPRIRSCVPACCTDTCSTQDLAVAPCRRSDVRGGGVVGRCGHVDAGQRAALHRRIAAQQHSRADLRLQRLRPADRQRDRQRHRRRRWQPGWWVAVAAACGVRPASPGCSVRRWAAQISWLIPAALGHAARRVVALASRGTHQQAARRNRAVGRHADREWTHPELEQRHHSPLLHGRPCAGDRCTRRHRRHRTVAPPRAAGCHAYSCRPRSR